MPEMREVEGAGSGRLVVLKAAPCDGGHDVLGDVPHQRGCGLEFALGYLVRAWSFQDLLVDRVIA